MRRGFRQSGQTTSEYVLVISVLLVAVVWVAYFILSPTYEQGQVDFNQKLEQEISLGTTDTRKVPGTTVTRQVPR